MPELKTKYNNKDLPVTSKMRTPKASIKVVLYFPWKCSPVGLSILESLKITLLAQIFIGHRSGAENVYSQRESS